MTFGWEVGSPWDPLTESKRSGFNSAAKMPNIFGLWNYVAILKVSYYTLSRVALERPLAKVKPRKLLCAARVVAIQKSRANNAEQVWRCTPFRVSDFQSSASRYVLRRFAGITPARFPSRLAWS